jgi:hypothetical protein
MRVDVQAALQSEFYRREAERTGLQFIAVEIETGMTLAALARSDYSRGDREGGSRAQAEAAKAYMSARRYIQCAHGGGPEIEALKELLMHLSKTLDRLRCIAEEV